MATKKTTKKEVEVVEEKALVTQEPPKQSLVLEGDPDMQMDFAIKAANALMRAVSQKKKPVMIRGEQYLEYGDWQVLGRFYGATASVAWSKKLTNEEGKFIGYEARAEVLHNGVIISAAEAMCMKEERNWKDRDEFMLRSMAQTRAASKALRNAYGWVAELAGMKSTPAEEMADVTPSIQPYKVERVIQAEDDDEQSEPIHQFMEKAETDAMYESRKEEIKELLSQLGVKPANLTEARTVINELTGLLFFEENYYKIIEVLKKKVESNDPIAAFLKE